MGERESVERPGAKENVALAAQPKQSVFSLKNIAILIIGVTASSLFAVFTVGGYLAPTLEQRRSEQSRASSSVASELESLSFVSIEPLIVNPANSNGERYLKATVSLETHDPKVVEELNKRLPQIKNQINTVLSSKTIEQLQTNEDRERLRREIQNRVNGLLLTGSISNVYFEEFVCQ
jgi:flagellar FliL protein